MRERRTRAMTIEITPTTTSTIDTNHKGPRVLPWFLLGRISPIAPATTNTIPTTSPVVVDLFISIYTYLMTVI